MNNSKDKFGEFFPPISKEEWLKKIQSDLKGKELGEISWRPFGSQSISPAIHNEDLTESLEVLIDRSEFNKIPTFFIEVESGHDLKNRIMQLLNFGVGRLVFSSSENQADLIENSLVDVDRNMVDIHIQPKISIIEFSDSNQWLKSASELLKSNFSSDHIIQLNYSDDFYFNICATRAIKLIIQEKELNHLPLFISNYSCKSEIDLATQLLYCMPIYLAGLLSGVDGLSHTGSSELENSRLLINNCHLLILESGIPLHIDTIQGSFYLDYATYLFKSALQEELTPKSQES